MDKERIGIRDLGQNVSRVMERVKKGERLVVTEHGRPIAYLSPFSEDRTLEQMIADGDAIAPTKSFREFLKTPPIVIEGPPSEEILEELRADKV